jgi:hypothetical protein
VNIFVGGASWNACIGAEGWKDWAGDMAKAML